MIELLSTFLASLGKSAVDAVKPRRGQLLEAGAFWIAVLSFLLHQQPTGLVQAAFDWLGVPWTTEPIASWIAARSRPLFFCSAGVAVFMIAGVRKGAAHWALFTRGPAFLFMTFVLLLEVRASRLWVVALLLVLSVACGVADRDWQSSFVGLWAYPSWIAWFPLSALGSAAGFDRPTVLEGLTRWVPPTGSGEVQAVSDRLHEARGRLPIPTPSRIKPPHAS